MLEAIQKEIYVFSKNINTHEPEIKMYTFTSSFTFLMLTRRGVLVSDCMIPKARVPKGSLETV